jgi:hypothetical protein
VVVGARGHEWLGVIIVADGARVFFSILFVLVFVVRVFSSSGGKMFSNQHLNIFVLVVLHHGRGRGGGRGGGRGL